MPRHGRQVKESPGVQGGEPPLVDVWDFPYFPRKMAGFPGSLCWLLAASKIAVPFGICNFWMVNPWCRKSIATWLPEVGGWASWWLHWNSDWRRYPWYSQRYSSPFVAANLGDLLLTKHQEIRPKFSRSANCKVLPRNLTWNLKMMVWKMIFLFNWVIFRFHVKFQGCR